MSVDIPSFRRVRLHSGFCSHPLALAFFAVAVFLFFFGGPPGFRDGAHFYGPLFEYLVQELSAGRLPLWNPYENLGQPLAASPTTLFFYPPTLIALGVACLGKIDPQLVYTGFIGFHLFLALLTSYRLPRSWHCSREAAALATLAYTLGGNVLFHWNNAPFLIGAAWFPEALRQGDRLIRHGKTRNLFGLAVVAALMILGGDPQAVYHVALCLVVLLVFRSKNFRATGFSTLKLSLAGLLAFLLAGVQILPALELGAHSDRLLDSHRPWISAFSVPPWRLLEFLWPGAGGWQFPENARWFSAFRSERGIWTPSLYMGLLPAVLALLTLPKMFRSRQGAATAVLLLLFLLGGLGEWCGVYPALERLPGYGLFRYPGKLLTVASLMLALLAAQGFDRLRRDPTFCRRLLFVLRFYAVPIGIILAIVSLRANPFPKIPACPLFGPFDVERSRFILAFSTISIFLTITAVHVFQGRKPFLRLLLVVTALDLCAANAWMLASVPHFFIVLTEARGHGEVGHRDNPPPCLRASVREKSSVPIRIYRHPVWYPPKFGKTVSPNRIAEAAAWDRRTLFPRYTLPERINVMDVRGTLLMKSWYPVAGRLRRELKRGKPGEFEAQLARLGVRYVVTPQNVHLEADRIFRDSANDVTFWQIRNPASRDFVFYEPNRLAFDVSLAEPQRVVLTEQFFPGWRAFLDNGEELPIHAAEDVFRSVDLPAGEHRVTMIYNPTSLKLGALLSVCGLIALLASLSLTRKTQSRRRCPLLCFRQKKSRL